MKRNLLAAFLAIASSAFGQISIGPAESLSIQDGFSISIDGLMLMPSNPLLLSDITFTRSTTAVSLASGSSITRVHHVNNPFSFTGIVTLHYNDAELNGNQENNLRLVLKNSNSWIIQPNPGMHDLTNNFLEHSMGGTIEGVTLGETGQILPLIANSLTAKWINNQIQIQWSVSQNELYKSFIVESSTDRKPWKNIQTVSSSNRVGNETYTVRDLETNFESKQYRIILKLQSGIEQRTSIVNLPKNRNQKVAILNKNQGVDFLFTEIPEIVSVYNRVGQEIWRSIESKTVYSVSQLLPGVYYLRFYKAREWKTRSFIISN